MSFNIEVRTQSRVNHYLPALESLTLRGSDPQGYWRSLSGGPEGPGPQGNWRGVAAESRNSRLLFRKRSMLTPQPGAFPERRSWSTPSSRFSPDRCSRPVVGSGGDAADWRLHTETLIRRLDLRRPQATMGVASPNWRPLDSDAGWRGNSAGGGRQDLSGGVDTRGYASRDTLSEPSPQSAMMRLMRFRSRTAMIFGGKGTERAGEEHARKAAHLEDPVYADPLENCSPAFQRRIADIFSHENDTIRSEKKLKRKV